MIDINEARALAAVLDKDCGVYPRAKTAATTITALADRLAEVETKERLTYGQWGLTVKLYEQTKASLATATEALRKIKENEDQFGMSWAAEVARTTLSTIEAGTAEHPDSVRLAHDAKAWKMVAQTMERSRDDVRSALKELLDAYSACFPPGNPWGDKARKTLGIYAPVFEGHDPTNPFAPRERPKKSIRLMTDAERRAAGLDPNGGFDGPTGAD